MIKLIIFDLDGTLVDSSLDITNAINFALEGTGIPTLDNRKTITLIGEGINRLIEKLLEPDRSDMHEKVLTSFLDHYSRHLVDNTLPYPHVRETLAELPDFQKAVLSNKRESFSREILIRLDLADHFDPVLGSDSVKERKPSPAGVQSILQRYDIGPEAAVIVGDSDIDILTGKKAGIRSVGVTYGYRPRKLLVAADHLIDNFRDLERVVKVLL